MKIATQRDRLIERQDEPEQRIAPVAIKVVNVTRGHESEVVVPPPDQDIDAIARLAIKAARSRGALGDRWLLHKKHHVKRLDGRASVEVIPEFLKSKKVRKVK